MISNINGPDFIGVGSQGCGSTFLREILDTHPSLSMHPEEANFFNRRILTKEPNWYFQFFQEADAQHSGEISPNYAVMRPQEIRLTQELFPDLKIILMVRHPVDRMWSALRRHWTFSYLPDVASIGQELDDMLRFADQRLHDAFGDYVSIWNNWTSVFAADRIKVVRFDALKNRENQTLREILHFIGVEDSAWVPEDRSVPNHSKVDIEMPDFFRYYLSRRYLSRTRRFNREMNGLVDDWVKNMETCVERAPIRWRGRYYARTAYSYGPVQLMHAVVDPVRFRWETYVARRRLAAQ